MKIWGCGYFLVIQYDNSHNGQAGFMAPAVPCRSVFRVFRGLISCVLTLSPPDRLRSERKQVGCEVVLGQCFSCALLLLVQSLSLLFKTHLVSSHCWIFVSRLAPPQLPHQDLTRGSSNTPGTWSMRGQQKMFLYFLAASQTPSDWTC